MIAFLMRLWIIPVSSLPMSWLHRLSDLLFFVIYRVFAYRTRVVRENLQRCFPAESAEWRLSVEEKFYRHLCDLIFESLKTFTISEGELRQRFVFLTPEASQKYWSEQKNLIGISSHHNSWEWNALSLSIELKHETFGVYKPLASPAWDRLFFESRSRFGIRMIPIRAIRSVLDAPCNRPYLLGLLADQAPHDYSKSFEVPFFGMPTWVTPGPAVIAIQRGALPVYGRVEKVARSRYQWTLEPIEVSEHHIQLARQDAEQVRRIAQAHQLTTEQAVQAIALTAEYTQRIENQIKMAPEFWLWSHRRFKVR